MGYIVSKVPLRVGLLGEGTDVGQCLVNENKISSFKEKAKNNNKDFLTYVGICSLFKEVLIDSIKEIESQKQTNLSLEDDLFPALVKKINCSM